MKGNSQFHGFNWCQTRIISFSSHTKFLEFKLKEIPYTALRNAERNSGNFDRYEITVFILILALILVCLLN